MEITLKFKYLFFSLISVQNLTSLGISNQILNILEARCQGIVANRSSTNTRGRIWLGIPYLQISRDHTFLPTLIVNFCI